MTPSFRRLRTWRRSASNRAHTTLPRRVGSPDRRPMQKPGAAAMVIVEGGGLPGEAGGERRGDERVPLALALPGRSWARAKS
jgi:hypothetical protein